MAPFRGRGQGRGQGRGRGRGRGRGGRAVGRHAFTKSRIEDSESDSENPQVEDEPMDSGPEDDQISEDDADEEPAPAQKPYSALLQSLQSEHQEEPRKKRRKLEHPTTAESTFAAEDDQAAESQDLEEAERQEVSDSDDEAEDSDEEDLSDPFESHFSRPDEKELPKRLKAIEDNQWETKKTDIPGVGRCTTLSPGSDELSKKAPFSPEQLKLKQKLGLKAKELLPEFSNIQKNIAAPLYNYQDILFGGRTARNAQSLRDMTCLHALNHVFKTRDRVVKNNARLARENDSDQLELRDQGFTRPKVLMLLETRQACVRAVDTIMKLSEPEQQENKKRFQDTFDQVEERFGEEKPEDFRELFEGNDDNDYRLGLKFTRKTVKYFSQFYNSDIIFASPLGLRRAIEKGGDKKKKDFDFLSSIELVVVDQADAMLMQNWEHVEYIFSHLNLQPKDAHGCDFSRVRTWYLDNKAPHFRQTVVLSAYLTPELNSLFNKHMRNLAGKVKIQPTYDGTMLDIGLSIKQTFSRYDSPSPASDPDARFKHFTSAIVPALTRLPKPAEGGKGILIFIPSYLDFVRVRNYFATSSTTQNVSFGAVSEYAEQAEVRRARSHFLTGRHSVLLYTGRAHHFRRHLIKGVKRVVMYALPENPLFYKEVVGDFLGSSIAEGKLDPSEASVRCVFSKWDGLRLERVVGTKRVGSMLREKSGDTFDFI
ncbi:U3 small nucleolar RNA-associated protein 25 [Phyllosticta citrichinensis]|uniref:U3 small nucleolar RNA-associated protein 25 n=1 Tax=Phyllosticta citrichinensis TaxID=1130410 RepID=A0ABR1Y297_9PEZI